MASEPDAILYGTDLFGNPMSPDIRGPLAERFVVPPFSVLSARDGFWQDRKRAWLRLGIQSEIGRGTTIVPNSGHRPESGDGCWSRSFGRTFGQGLVKGENAKFGSADHTQQTTGASVFDPVLCELAYRWFCPPGGQVVDPFAGGSVRGIVAAILGYRYWGCDLRAEQIEANRPQAKGIIPDTPDAVEWIAGDALDELANAPVADFVFSCPPYGNLEVYSDDPRDLSNMEWHMFVANYKRIILLACKQLKVNRFACFVVANFRGKDGFYQDLVGETIRGFADCGLRLYNDAVLVTAVGSLPIRVGKQFVSGRKLGKTHQNMLVFCKGDWRIAARATDPQEQ